MTIMTNKVLYNFVAFTNFAKINTKIRTINMMTNKPKYLTYFNYSYREDLLLSN